MSGQYDLQYRASVVASESIRHKELYTQILEYFEKRELKWPTMEEALMWAHTESGEVTEQLLTRMPGWVRNHPEKIRDGSDKAVIEEIGDQVFMLLIAGMVMKWDVLEAMQCKMERKLEELNEETT